MSSTILEIVSTLAWPAVVIAAVILHRNTIRQARHVGWLYPDGVNLRDPDVYGERPCVCGCGMTATDARALREDSGRD